MLPDKRTPNQELSDVGNAGNLTELNLLKNNAYIVDITRSQDHWPEKEHPKSHVLNIIE